MDCDKIVNVKISQSIAKHKTINNLKSKNCVGCRRQNEEGYHDVHTLSATLNLNNQPICFT
ncbi:hypothetical protein FHS10_001017 [Mucilaginibacter dorajii]|nr:hypothetical protein [Mucilaginibacter dorajii]